MNRLTEETIKQATVGKMMTCQEVSSYSPQEIREAISGLVAEHKTILAEALVEAGLALYPESEDILAIASLMAMQRQDWGQTSSLLRSLIDQQGVNATPYSYIMLVRALRCNLEYAEALSICIDAHEKHPGHPDIDAEFKVLTSILGLKPMPEDEVSESDEDVLSPAALEKSDVSQVAVTSNTPQVGEKFNSVAKDFRLVLRIKFLGKLLPTHDDFSTVSLFCIPQARKLSKNIMERTKILLINTLIFGIKSAYMANKEKELWDSVSKNRILFRRMIWL